MVYSVVFGLCDCFVLFCGFVGLVEVVVCEFGGVVVCFFVVVTRGRNCMVVVRFFKLFGGIVN